LNCIIIFNFYRKQWNRTHPVQKNPTMNSLSSLNQLFTINLLILLPNRPPTLLLTGPTALLSLLSFSVLIIWPQDFTLLSLESFNFRPTLARLIIVFLLLEMEISIRPRILLLLLNKILLSFSIYKCRTSLNLIHLFLSISKSNDVCITKPISKWKKHSASMVHHWIHKLMLYLVADMHHFILKENSKLSTQNIAFHFKSALHKFLSQIKTISLLPKLTLLFNGSTSKTKDSETGWPWTQTKR
jgi:hypothetical protein